MAGFYWTMAEKRIVLMHYPSSGGRGCQARLLAAGHKRRSLDCIRSFAAREEIKRISLASKCREHGVNVETVRYRISTHGMDLHTALTTKKYACYDKRSESWKLRKGAES